MLYEIIGYFGLVLNLYSMYTKGELKLRIYSVFANLVYILYGSLIQATPIIIGCTIAVILHTYRIHYIKQNIYVANKEG